MQGKYSKSGKYITYNEPQVGYLNHLKSDAGKFQCPTTNILFVFGLSLMLISYITLHHLRLIAIIPLLRFIVFSFFQFDHRNVKININTYGIFR
jgi:hypothetical protein